MNQDHLRLLLEGLAAGDSLGSTSEFQNPQAVSATYQKHAPSGWPFRQVGGGPFGWSPGDPTDDTEMAMCITRAVAAWGGRFDATAVADQFVVWYSKGPRDVGGTTAQALRRRQAGAAWFDSGYDGYRGNPGHSANGSLMRNGVVAALSNDLNDVIRYTFEQAIVTHYDPLSVLCCGVQSCLLRRLLESHKPVAPPDGGVDAWVRAGAQTFIHWLTHDQERATRLWLERVGEGAISRAVNTFLAADFSLSVDPFASQWQALGQGYSLLTLQIGIWALNWALRDEPYPHVPAHLPAEPFRRTGSDVLGWVALIGRDSDTYGACAGPLITATRGRLPASMTEQLTALQEYDALTHNNPKEAL